MADNGKIREILIQSEIFDTGAAVDEVEQRIGNLLDRGYTFDGASHAMLHDHDRDNPAYHSLDDAKRKTDYHIMMFHNSEGKVRYCIASYDDMYEQWNRATLSLSQLKFYDKEFDDYVKYLEDVSDAFAKKNIHVTPDTLWQYYNASSNPQRQTERDIDPEEAVKSFTENFIENLSTLGLDSAVAGRNIAQDLGFGRDDFKVLAVKDVTHINREAQADITPWLNHPDAARSVAEATQEIGRAIVDNYLASEEDKSALLKADVARALGMENDMLEYIRDELMNGRDESVIDNYMMDYSNKGGVGEEAAKVAEHHTFKGIRDQVFDALASGEKLNGKRVNHGLQVIANRIRNTSEKMNISALTEAKAMKNIIAKFMREPDDSLDKTSYGELMRNISYDKYSPESTSQSMHFIEAAAAAGPDEVLKDIFETAAEKDDVIEPEAVNLSVTELQRKLAYALGQNEHIHDEHLTPARRLQELTKELVNIECDFNNAPSNLHAEPVLSMNNTYPDIYLCGEKITMPDVFTEGKLFKELVEAAAKTIDFPASAEEDRRMAVQESKNMAESHGRSKEAVEAVPEK